MVRSVKIYKIMKITTSLLRKMIAEEISNKKLLVLEDNNTLDSAGTTGLTDQQKAKLKALSGSPPSSLTQFSTSMKNLGAILADVDEKSANLNSEQLKKYFMQIMSIVDGMMSSEKTTSAETSKIKKIVDQ